MVRLRTQRWYSADGQRRSQSRVAQQIAGSRRLLSLCFLLALVLVLMQKAADPQQVRNAFKALGVPLDESAERDERPRHQGQLESTRAGSPPAHAVSQSFSSLSAWEIACRDLVARMLDELTDSEVVHLAKGWFAPRTLPVASEHDSTASGELGAQILQPKLTERSALILDRLADETRQSAVAEGEKAAWLQQLEKFRQQWQQLGDGPQLRQLPSTISPELRSSFTRYLDQRLVAILRDGTPWNKSEMLPFWRLLQRGKSETEEGIVGLERTISSVSSSTPSVNALQLAAEADALRGARIRFRGSVRRVEYINRSYAPLGMDGGYWVIWLRGVDEAVQPVAVYSSDSRAAELAEQLKPNTLDYPEVEVEAIFGKRLAYASESGVQVAPTLFATDLTTFKPPPAPFATKSTNELWGQFLIAVLGGSLLAAAILIPISWQRQDKTLRKAARSARPHSPKPVERVDETRTGHVASSLLMVAAVLSVMTLGMTNAKSQATSEKDSGESPELSQTSAVTPPWAMKQAVDPLQDVFVANLQSLFDQAAIDELRAMQENAANPFPDSLLKAVHATRRIGWPRALQLTNSVSLADGVTLSVRTVNGWVRLATPVLLSESQQSWFQLQDDERLFRVEVQLQTNLFDNVLGKQGTPAGSLLDADQRAELVTLYCQELPQMWLSSAQLRQPARFTVLAFEDVDHHPALLCGLALRPQWLLPSDSSPSKSDELLTPVLPKHYLELGRLGWDLTNLDMIADHNQQALASQEAAGFYSLIRILGAAQPELAGIERPFQEPLDRPLSILSQSQQSVGKELAWPVRIVSATVVDVDQTEHRQQLGAESYLQFDGFVDIGADRIRFQPAATGQASQALEFEGEFPVTIVTRVESPLVSRQRIAAGQKSWSVGKYAIVTGRFYRMWSYQSELVKSSGQAARQIAPLVIASSVVPTTPPARDKASQVGWFGWALCGAMIVILAGILSSAMPRPGRNKSK